MPHTDKNIKQQHATEHKESVEMSSDDKKTVTDDKTEGKTGPDNKELIEMSDSEKETTTSKKIVQPTADEIEAYKITVTVQVDTSKLPPPVPEGKQGPKFLLLHNVQ